jgi:hypothetical protein
MYYVWCMMCEDWAVYHELFMYLCYFLMFSHKGSTYEYEYRYEIQYGLNFKVVYITRISLLM